MSPSPTIAELTRALATGPAQVVIEPPGSGAGFWAGGPSAVFADGRVHLAYRLRRPVDQGRGYANVIAESSDGVHFRTGAVLAAADFDCGSLERPALVRRPDGGWRVYVSCSTRGSKHWWVEAVDAPPGSGAEGLAAGTRTVVLPGGADGAAWKDVVVTHDGGLWSMWACRHPLDGGDDEADRMQTWYATSRDGLGWSLHGPALQPVADSWNQRGTRLTSVWGDSGQVLATFDGRASAAENWHERTGFAAGAQPGALAVVGGPVLRHGRSFRYVCLLPTPDGTRVYFEAERADGSNDLRTVLVT